MNGDDGLLPPESAAAAAAAAATGASSSVSADDEKNQLVPQLSDHNVTYKDLQTAVRVLNAVSGLRPSSETFRRKQKKGKHQQQQQSSSQDNNKNGKEEKEKRKRERLEAYKQSNLRPFRKALASCLELHRLTMFQGKDEEQHYEQRKLERSLKRQKTAERDMAKRYIASSQLRQGRVERLQRLQDEAQEEEHAKANLLASSLIPDGHVETTPPTTAGTAAAVPLFANKETKSDSASVTSSGDTDAVTTSTSAGATTQLPHLRSCYVCKVRYREMHHFYDQLCPGCASLNWVKRHQSSNLGGRTAVVTGARVKIGFQTCLKLLRAGCTVVATTRFPNTAVQAYKQQSDFTTWQSRLHVYGLDLRDVTGIEAFTRFLKMQFGTQGIDILINNACQTVRRPVGYYMPLVEQEQTLWQEADGAHKAILQGCVEFERVRHKLDRDHKNHSSLLTGSETQRQQEQRNNVLLPEPMVQDVSAPGGEAESKPSALITSVATTATTNDTTNQGTKDTPFEASGVSHSAAMSQIILLPDDAGVSDSLLPPGVTDVNGQQLDLRRTNSWLLKMEEVSTPEVMECMFINAIAPFILNSRLKPLMTIPNDGSRPDRYIINVSAMEGKFYRYKMPNHPHTNMAKAALNMLTRTSAEDLAKQWRIYMNSVDTGWINDENPLEKARKTAENNFFQTPIDEIDAAARILDPIFTGVNEDGAGSKKGYGKFLKDYRETEW